MYSQEASSQQKKLLTYQTANRQSKCFRSKPNTWYSKNKHQFMNLGCNVENAVLNVFFIIEGYMNSKHA